MTDPEHPKADKPEIFIAAKSPLTSPSFSPDGRWLAYDSNETPPRQIFVRPFSSTRRATGGQWQISMNGGRAPLQWTRDGNELFYSGIDGSPYIVDYRANGESFVASPPRLWSQKLPPVAAPPVMMPDGKRLIVVLPSPEAVAGRQTHVSFLLNFSDELHRRMLARR